MEKNTQMQVARTAQPYGQDSMALWQENDKLAEVKKVFGKDLTDSEFAILVQIGKATTLNPFLKEIWAVKYGTNPAQIFIGRDGYRKVAQGNPDYDYHLVDAVYANDEFSIDNGEVRHKYSIKDRGALVGAYCVVKRVGSTKTTFNYVDLKEYTTGKSLWNTKPATMIKKVAEAQGLRMAFQQLFAGTYDEAEAWEEPKAKVQEMAVSAPSYEDLAMDLVGCLTIEEYKKKTAELSKLKTFLSEEQIQKLYKVALEVKNRLEGKLSKKEVAEESEPQQTTIS
jgi:phage recombination protein Bet